MGEGLEHRVPVDLEHLGDAVLGFDRRRHLGLLEHDDRRVDGLKDRRGADDPDDPVEHRLAGLGRSEAAHDRVAEARSSPAVGRPRARPPSSPSLDGATLRRGRRPRSARAAHSSAGPVTTTGHGALRTTWSETDPRSARRTPPRPREPMTITGRADLDGVVAHGVARAALEHDEAGVGQAELRAGSPPASTGQRPRGPGGRPRAPQATWCRQRTRCR